jgi:hypothetical protein
VLPDVLQQCQWVRRSRLQHPALVAKGLKVRAIQLIDSVRKLLRIEPAHTSALFCTAATVA